VPRHPKYPEHGESRLAVLIRGMRSPKLVTVPEKVSDCISRIADLSAATAVVLMAMPWEKELKVCKVIK